MGVLRGDVQVLGVRMMPRSPAWQNYGVEEPYSSYNTSLAVCMCVYIPTSACTLLEIGAVMDTGTKWVFL